MGETDETLFAGPPEVKVESGAAGERHVIHPRGVGEADPHGEPGGIGTEGERTAGGVTRQPGHAGRVGSRGRLGHPVKGTAGGAESEPGEPEPGFVDGVPAEIRIPGSFGRHIPIECFDFEIFCHDRCLPFCPSGVVPGIIYTQSTGNASGVS